MNGLYAFTVSTVHEQDLVVARHKNANYKYLLIMCYTALNVIPVHAYIALVLLANTVSHNISQATVLVHASKCQVKIEL